jgi:IclR family acetate operon transcriptional repressor
MHEAGRVQALDRALRLLEALSESPDGSRLSELSARTGLSPSTTHRLLTTLEHRRFVQFDRMGSLWHIGRQAYTVGATFLQQRNFVAPALPFLRRLRDATRETANLGIVDDGEMVVLTQVESREIMRAITRVGGRAPITSSGMGKAILATYPAVEIDAIMERQGLRRLTPNTITRVKQLRQHLREVAARGYAVDDEEYVMGLRCVAAPVRNHQGDALCAISVSGLPARMTPERLPIIGKLVADTAMELSSLLA